MAFHLEPNRGEGPGVITQDGCAVDVYLKMPYRGELDVLAGHLPSGCSILELGCGTGRLTQHLLSRGHRVTAVDNSPDMLRHVPDAAHKVCCDIERLELGRTFDVVLLASNLINVAEDSLRHQQLAACRRHLSPAGVLLFQRFDPTWLREVRPGPYPSIGEMEIAIERVLPHGPFVEMSVRYASDGAQWKQHFTARVLDDEDIRRALRDAGLDAPSWIDARWGATRR